MYKSFEVRNFRGFRKLRIDELARVNLIAGFNNVGKTALLEALFLHCGAYNPNLAVTINLLRGIQMLKIELGRGAETPLDSIFHQFDTSQPIELIGQDTIIGFRRLRFKMLKDPSELAKATKFIYSGYSGSSGVQNLAKTGAEKISETDISQKAINSSETSKIFELEYQLENQVNDYYLIMDLTGFRVAPLPPSPPFPTFYKGAVGHESMKDLSERFSNLEIRGEQNLLSPILTLIEPHFKRLVVAILAGEPMLHADVGQNRLIPLPIMGEGMIRLVGFTVHLANAPDGVVLFDEIENGLHHSIMPKVWRVLGELARRFNVQVFATTHSLECIVSAHKAFTENGHYDFRLHRLERVKEDIKSITYDQEALAAAIETGLEVR